MMNAQAIDNAAQELVELMRINFQGRHLPHSTVKHILWKWLGAGAPPKEG